MGTGLVYGMFVAVLLSIALCGNVDDRQRLMKDLTKGYVVGVEPDPTDLKMGLAILCSTFDRIHGELVTSAWERHSWTDSRLRWEPADYDGIKTIRMPAESIWIPDMKLYNSLRPFEERRLTYTVVTSDGSVLWIPPVLYRTPCTPNPSREESENEESEDEADFDCKLKLGSWVYDADTLKLKLMDDHIDQSNYLNDTCSLTIDRAEISVETKKYPCCAEPYSNILVELKLSRKTKED